MGAQAPGAILDAGLGINKAAAAVFPQGIQRAVTEDAAEFLRIRPRMAGKIFTFPVLEKVVMGHISLLTQRA